MRARTSPSQSASLVPGRLLPASAVSDARPAPGTTAASLLLGCGPWKFNRPRLRASTPPPRWPAETGRTVDKGPAMIKMTGQSVIMGRADPRRVRQDMRLVTNLDEPGWAGSASRQAALPAQPLRNLHRGVLRRFLDTGAPPTLRWVRQEAQNSASTTRRQTRWRPPAASTSTTRRSASPTRFPARRPDSRRNWTVSRPCTRCARSTRSASRRWRGGTAGSPPPIPATAPRRGLGPRRSVAVDTRRRGRRLRPHGGLRHRLRLLGGDVPAHHLPRQPRQRAGLSLRPQRDRERDPRPACRYRTRGADLRSAARRPGITAGELLDPLQR